MASVIIVEGVDRVGKTTLVNKLHSKLSGFKVYKNKDTALMKLEDFDCTNEADKMIKLLRMIKLLDGNVIFDRFYLTDAIYGITERGYDPNTSAKAVVAIEKALMSLFGADNVYLVIMKSEDIIESSCQHGKDLTEYEQAFLQQAYLNLIRNVIIAEYGTIDEVVDFLCDKL